MIINQSVRIGGGVKLPVGIIQLQGGADRAKVALAKSINILHVDPVDGSPIIRVGLEVVL